MAWWGYLLVVLLIGSGLMAAICLIALSLPWYPDDDGFSDEEDV